MTPEGRLKSAIKKMLDGRGAFWSMIPGGAYAKIGDPDMVVCYHGYYIAIEAKATTKQREWQKLRQQQIEAAGGIYIVPHTVKEVADVLDAIDQLK